MLDPLSNEVIWAQSFPCMYGKYSNYAYSLSLDQATVNVYTAMQYAYGITMGPYTFSTGQQDCLTAALTKTGPDGTVLWAITLQNDYPNGASSSALATAADPATGNAAWAGGF